MLRLGRARIPVEEGDTIASAMYRSGIRTFSRSLKYHRRRGLYCGTGECPNCSLTVDGVPGIRACVTPAADGMRVRRERGWPSTERDVLAILDRLHALLPVGFYYKTFIRPRWLWSVADRIIRRSVGAGPLAGGSGRVARGPASPLRRARHRGRVVGPGRRRRRPPQTSTWCSATRARWRIPRKGSTSSRGTRRSASTKDRWWRSPRRTASCRCIPGGSWRRRAAPRCTRSSPATTCPG